MDIYDDLKSTERTIYAEAKPNLAFDIIPSHINFWLLKFLEKKNNVPNFRKWTQNCLINNICMSRLRLILNEKKSPKWNFNHLNGYLGRGEGCVSESEFQSFVDLVYGIQDKKICVNEVKFIEYRSKEMLSVPKSLLKLDFLDST